MNKYVVASLIALLSVSLMIVPQFTSNADDSNNGSVSSSNGLEDVINSIGNINLETPVKKIVLDPATSIPKSLTLGNLEDLSIESLDSIQQLQLLQSFAEVKSNLPSEISKEKSLLIRDLGVVESSEADVGGAFHIGTLLNSMAVEGQVTAGELMFSILNSIATTKRINGHKVGSRRGANRILKRWKKQDGVKRGVQDSVWAKSMNFENAPFRLLAIVNRMDLALNPYSELNPCPGDQFSAGEGRLVFGYIAPKDKKEMKFTLIFEYNLVANSEEERKHWAEKWINLSTYEEFDAEYLKALVDVVKGYTGAGTDLSKPNGNSIKQVRTNEIRLNPFLSTKSGWQLREFTLTKNIIKDSAYTFESATRKMVPHMYVKNKILKAYMEENSAAILNKDYCVPVTFTMPDSSEEPFLAGEVLIQNKVSGLISFGRRFAEKFTWTRRLEKLGVDSKVAKIFSTNTCNGCHSGDTNTKFVHVEARKSGNTSKISEFLMEDLFSRDSILNNATKSKEEWIAYENILDNEMEKMSSGENYIFTSESDPEKYIAVTKEDLQKIRNYIDVAAVEKIRHERKSRVH